jgi:hypothetical protein
LFSKAQLLNGTFFVATRRFADLQGLKACADMSNSFVHTKLIQEKPALMAFYKRLTEQAYPSGRSEKWAK